MTYESNPLGDAYKINPRSKNDNPREAMLTNGCRRFLGGDRSGYTASQQTDYKKAIRERVHNTILDFYYLTHELSQEEIQDIFNPAEEEATAMKRGLANMISFLYFGLPKDEGPELTKYQDLDTTFEKNIRSGIEKAEKLRHGDGPLKVDAEFEGVEVKVSSLESMNPKRPLKKAAKGNFDEMSDVEIEVALMALSMNEDWSYLNAFAGQDPLEYFEETLESEGGLTADRWGEEES